MNNKTLRNKNLTNILSGTHVRRVLLNRNDFDMYQISRNYIVTLKYDVFVKYKNGVRLNYL